MKIMLNILRSESFFQKILFILVFPVIICATSIEDFTKIIEGNLKDAEAYKNRGLAYYTEGNYDKAIADYTKAIELNPKYAVTYDRRGNAYSKQGNYDKAMADYTKAIGLDPKYAVAYHNRGFAYSLQRNYDKAITDYTKAIVLDPKYAVAYDHRGNAYSLQRNYDKAMADYTKAIELDPKYAVAYHNRAFAYSKQGNYNKAMADYIKAKEYTLPSKSGPDINLANSNKKESQKKEETNNILNSSKLKAISDEKKDFNPNENKSTGLNIANQGLSDSFRTFLFKTGKFKVVDRTQMEEIMKEQKFQLTGCTETECAVEIGKILNAKYMLTGSISKISNEYIINIKIASVETAQIKLAEIEKCKESDLLSALKIIASRIASNEKFQQATTMETIAVLDLK